MATLAKAIRIAAEAHIDQFDRVGDPYVLHPLRLMQHVQGEAARIAAILHDVIEDTSWTLDGLREEGFSAEVLDAVDALTHREGESYEDYVRRAARNPIARAVKLADLADNMNLGRIPHPTDRDWERLQRYVRARRVLLEE